MAWKTETIKPAATAKPAAKPVRPTSSLADRSRTAAHLMGQATEPTRVHILLFLRGGGRNVTEICAELGYGQPVVSHHLKILLLGEMVEVERAGKFRVYGLSARGGRLVEAIEMVAAA